MNEEREKVRCQSCELVQWSDQANCRRCGSALPEPVVKVVERVVETVVIRHDPQCLENLDEARKLILAATERLTQQPVEAAASIALAHVQETEVFPTMAEVERATDRGSISEVESQASGSCAPARNREDDVLPKA